jgi:predicted transcriptional regulator
MSQVIEIGEARRIKVSEARAYLRHIEGNPAEEALLIRELLNAGFTQRQVAEKLGMSQPRVSTRLRLLKLIPDLFRRLREGELRPSAAYALARLTAEEQERFLHVERITVREAEARARGSALTPEVVELLGRREEGWRPTPAEFRCGAEVRVGDGGWRILLKVPRSVYGAVREAEEGGRKSRRFPVTLVLEPVEGAA